MPDRSLAASSFQTMPAALQSLAGNFLARYTTDAERVQALEAALQSNVGPLLREEMGRWIARHIVPVERLVPRVHNKWYPPVRDAMSFVVIRLSAERLAPKIIEQISLPQQTPPELRVLRLIARVPGIQKLGQVLARDRHLRPGLQRALSRLENGIRDVAPEDICAIIRAKLSPRLEQYKVQITPRILAEGSVSAVVPFTWWNRGSKSRERGVFKVLKPQVPGFFAEDMDLLEDLAEFFSAKHQEYSFAPDVISDTFLKVRQLLEHEVDFAGEQVSLLKAHSDYLHVSGIRVPKVIQPLCSSNITAMSFEAGIKITSAVNQLSPSARARVATQLIAGLTAVPLCSTKSQSIFHADPHAGNLLYNRRTEEIVLLDWALTDHLSQEQRRHLALLVIMVALRDPFGTCDEITALTSPSVRYDSRKTDVIRNAVVPFLAGVQLTHGPYLLEAMLLLQRVALRGIRFPGSLIMFAKVLFTLDGVLQDIGATSLQVRSSIANRLIREWLANPGAFPSPLSAKDCSRIPWNAALYGARVFIQWQESQLNRYLG